jgi:hypothetical protein
MTMFRRRGLGMVVLLASVGATSLAALALAASNSGSPPASGQRGNAMTTASHRRTAIRDAKQLLRGVAPPAGAVLQSSGTAIGAHAQLLTAALASAVAYRTWTVPGDPASVLSFVQAHLPAGSRVVSSGYGGRPTTQSVTRSWPPVAGILDDRLLEIAVTPRANGGTRLYTEAQSQWVIARPTGEHIPAGVREVDVTESWPGKAPFLSRRVTRRSDVHRLVTLFNSLGIVQPVGINCPSESAGPVVEIGFREGRTGAIVALAKVSPSADLSWPASVPGWACFAIAFNVRGRNWTALVGNVITPIEHLLHLKFARR